MLSAGRSSASRDPMASPSTAISTARTTSAARSAPKLLAPVRAGSTGGQGEPHAREQGEQRRRVPGEEEVRPGRLAALVVGGRQDVDGHETDERQTAGRAKD